MVSAKFWGRALSSRAPPDDPWLRCPYGVIQCTFDRPRFPFPAPRCRRKRRDALGTGIADWH